MFQDRPMGLQTTAENIHVDTYAVRAGRVFGMRRNFLDARPTLEDQSTSEEWSRTRETWVETLILESLDIH